MNSELSSCRICMKSIASNKVISLFPNRLEIAKQIYLISSVKIDDIDAVICQKCLKRLKDAIKLRNDCIKADRHIKLIHGNFSSLESFDKGGANEPKQKYQCTNCSKFFTSLYYLKQHEKAQHMSIDPEECFICNNCDFISKTKSLMRAHQLNNHCNIEEKKNVKFQCKFCGRLSKSIGALYAHEKTHREIPLDEYLICKYCEKSFKEKRLLKNHIQLVHEKSLSRQCSYDSCVFIATCAGSLSKHIKAVHLKLKNFECDECEKKFCTNQQLLRHQRSHRGQKPFKCLNESCEKFFADSHGRKRHLKICVFKNTS